jgi:chromosome segregation ATPase
MFQLIKDDEVARAQLSALKGEVEHMCSLLAALRERIAAQEGRLQELDDRLAEHERARDLADRQARDEGAQEFAERHDRTEEVQAGLADRIASLEDKNAALHHDRDQLVALTAELEARLSVSERGNLQMNANLVRLERQAEIDLRETRTSGKALAELLFELRGKLAEVPATRGREI